MTAVSYRMAGSGSWQNLLPDKSSQQLYAKIYPAGIPLPKAGNQLYQVLNAWQKGGIVRFEGQKAIPTGPVMTDEDLVTLDPWFRDISDSMCDVVRDHLPEYHALASKLSGDKSPAKQEFRNILTIQICAHTLDSWVFSLMRQEYIGTYPPRDFAGTFFFWGYGFSTGPKRIYGFTTYGGRSMMQLHVLRSHGLDREKLKLILRRYDTLNYLQHLYSGNRMGNGSARGNYPDAIETESNIGIISIVDTLREHKILEPDNPPRFAIPVFTDRYMVPAVELFRTVSGKIMGGIIDRMDGLKELVNRCSFSQCSWSDILCMLFHLAYSYAADKLVEKGTIPDFPQSACGEWGVWIH